MAITIKLDGNANIIVGSDTASTTAKQFLIFLLSQLQGTDNADFQLDPNSEIKNIAYDHDTHVLSWNEWGSDTSYSMTTHDLQTYCDSCIAQVEDTDYATSEQAKAIIRSLTDLASAVGAIPTDTASSGSVQSIAEAVSGLPTPASPGDVAAVGELVTALPTPATQQQVSDLLSPISTKVTHIEALVEQGGGEVPESVLKQIDDIDSRTQTNKKLSITNVVISTLAAGLSAVDVAKKSDASARPKEVTNGDQL